MNKGGFINIAIILIIGAVVTGVAITREPIKSALFGSGGLEITSDPNAATFPADLTTDVTGVLPQANGGTNANTDFTAGSVLFDDGTRFVQDNANFFFDDTNNKLGIGTVTPGTALAVGGAGLFEGFVHAAYFTSTSTTATSSFEGAIAFESTGFVYEPSTGNIGIGGPPNEGTSLDRPLLHIFVDDAGETECAGLSHLCIESTGNSFISFITENADSNTQGIIFGDQNDDDAGRIRYQHSVNELQFFGNGIELLTLEATLTDFNPTTRDTNFRIQGDTNTNLFFVDASADRIGISTTVPGTIFAVAGAGLFEGFLNFAYLFSTSTHVNTLGGSLTITDTATSTFTGGLSVSTGGLLTTTGLTVTGGHILSSGRLEITSTATSTISGELLVTNGFQSLAFAVGGTQQNTFVAGTTTISWENGNYQESTQITGDTIINFENVRPGQTLRLSLPVEASGANSAFVAWATTSDTSLGQGAMPHIYWTSATDTPPILTEGYHVCSFAAATTSNTTYLGGNDVVFGACNLDFQPF